ncbi:zinc finger MYM-type protein 1-like [Sipha flava]|uniref:Zinc finger MYM-type protein 1-like n=1 Tax=Sipha flava TaxID=143950 RepID=A0A8B8FIP3_9HEMI|nr:zinc finger MYM-type protein 1-like [Sipha flava]
MKGLINKAKKGKNEYIRHFNTDYYAKHKWLCGCDIKLAVYCFPCLCFGGGISWTKTGVTYLGHLSEKIKKHENSFKHLQNEANLKVLGTINIFDKIDSGYKIRIQRHNEEIDKNRYILEKILNCIKFCGQHNLPLRGHNEKINSNNKGVFLGVIELCKNLDVSLRSHFENSKVFKGTSKTIQNDLLDCILLVTRKQILLEIETAQFVSIIVDETTDISNMFQLVIVFRYELKGQPVERFWGFLNPDGHNAESLTSTILSEINPILKNTPNKLIAQSYDGAAVMSGQKSGVNVRD